MWPVAVLHVSQHVADLDSFCSSAQGPTKLFANESAHLRREAQPF